MHGAFFTVREAARSGNLELAAAIERILHPDHVRALRDLRDAADPAP